MNTLESIALRRAEEQMQSDAWRNQDPGEARLSGRGPGCDCGECQTCARREAMRRYRAGVAAGIRKRGRYSLGKTCSRVDAEGNRCGERIADHNGTGFCSKCRRLDWQKANRDRRSGGDEG